MTTAFVALGSNIEPEAHLRQAARLLRERFANAHFSSGYRSAAFGFSGADFVNAVVGLETTLSIEALLDTLHGIERQCGRGPDDPRWGPRAIDLDLLLYGRHVGQGRGYTLPRPDLSKRAYMLGPLAELVPHLIYPPDGPSVAELWRALPCPPGALVRIELDLEQA
ncbi:MAG TPA: 2-amino-4-hydroxy-6-hydroxymethyldihydropteridine diphosphokinase [Steroidobacteraceae bacterium]|nr:2-amino-4-hydroxy-6-hydroxymethyldihydropteridine diphosphokinase [Steroidobacteraceae bacterium]